MPSTLSRALSVGGFSLAIFGLSGALAQTASAAGASAYGVTASFTSGGVTTVINPVNKLAGGAASSTFDKAKNSGAYQKMLILSAGATPVPALVVTAKNFLSHVKGGFGVDTISAEGDATTTGLDISLQLYRRCRARFLNRSSTSRRPGFMIPPAIISSLHPWPASMLMPISAGSRSAAPCCTA
jgi:hypothetical protein